MIGNSNESLVTFCGKEALGLIDSGSQVTTVCEEFYRTLDPPPSEVPIQDFNLVVHGPDGKELDYLCCVAVTVEVPFQITPIHTLALVVPNTRYNSQVPLIIGTNVIREAKVDQCTDSNVPTEWQNAFISLHNGFVGYVKSTNKYNVDIAPMQTVTFSGLVRKIRNAESAVTENTETATSRLGVCPRVVALDKVGSYQRVPIRVFNMSAKTMTVTPQTVLCELQEVKVLREADLEIDQKVENSARMASQRIEEQESELPTGVNLDESDLNEEQKDLAEKLFRKWNSIFSKGDLDIGRTKLVEHHIKLNNEEPFKDPHRRIPPGIITEVREHLQEMLNAGVIRNSESPFSSNVVIVRKKDGTIRFCVDYRKLNNRTIKDAYAIPRIEDSLHLLAGSKYFSKLDLRSGYWQVEVKEEDKAKTAFKVGTLGFFEFNRMPFGLCNAPATFQRLMERSMGDINLRDCLIYLDDIVVFSSTFEEHVDRLEAVFKRLKRNNLKLKASKCEFFKREVTYLGHVVSQEGIQTDPSKIDAVKTWPVPKTVKEVRMFLGFTGYYRRFVKGYASIVRPLNDLLIGHPTNKAAAKDQKGNNKPPPFVWGNEQQTAFETVIDKLTEPPVLAYADYRLPFKLHTDASTSGLGAVLYQTQDGIDRVVAYASRSLKPAEKNYPAHKLEFLALKWAVTDKFHDYLYGSKFEAMTDNNPLTYVLTSAKLDATGQRWVAALSSYNFSLTYRSGISNRDADGLSRKVESTEPSEGVQFPEILKAISQSVNASVEEHPYIDSLTASTSEGNQAGDEDIPQELLRSTALSKQDWIKAQRDDREICLILDFIISGQRPDSKQAETQNLDKRYIKEWDRLKIENDILLRCSTLQGQDSQQLVLPARFREDIFNAYHDDMGHQGRDRTLSLMKRRVYWPGMDTYVEKMIKRCDRCIRRKVLPTRAADLVNITSTAPMEVVCIDYLTIEPSKGGIENVLVITDHFTRYAQAIPARNQTAHTTARLLYENFFVHYGFPARIHSDQGANFESKLIKSLCDLTGMKKTRTTPYHPMGNGMVERFNRTLLNMLGTLQDNQKADWKSHLSTLTHAYNAATHDSTGFSPFYLMFGRHSRLAVDAFLGLPQSQQQVRSRQDYVDKLKQRMAFAYDTASSEARKSADRQKGYYDDKVRYTNLEVGDRVLVKNVGLRGKQKLADLWEHCPYVVRSQPVPSIPVFEVVKENSPGSKPRVLHRNMLLPFTGLPCPRTHTPEKKQPEKTNLDEHQQIGATPEPVSDHDESSSQSSAEEDEDEPTRPEPYVIPMRRTRGQGGLKPPTNRASDSDQNKQLSSRPQRNRRRPERFNSNEFVTRFTFTVPASQVIYL